MSRPAWLPGRPRLLPLDEIRNYFAGDRIVCLRCGKAYRGLASHLAAVHEMAADEYRSLYGLPWHRGLTSAETQRHNSEKIRRRFADGYLEVLLENGRRGRAAKAAHGFTMRRSHCHTEQSRLNGARAPHGVTTYGAGDFDRYLQLVAGGMSLTEAACEPGMPTWRWLRTWRLAHPGDEARLIALIEGMPFAFQARCGRLGDRFWRRVRELRAKELSDKAIATVLGVSERAVNAGRRKRGIA